MIGSISSVVLDRVLEIGVLDQDEVAVACSNPSRTAAPLPRAVSWSTKRTRLSPITLDDRRVPSLELLSTIMSWISTPRARPRVPVRSRLQPCRLRCKPPSRRTNVECVFGGMAKRKPPHTSSQGISRRDRRWRKGNGAGEPSIPIGRTT